MPPSPTASATLKVDVGDRHIELDVAGVPVPAAVRLLTAVAYVVEDYGDDTPPAAVVAEISRTEGIDAEWVDITDNVTTTTAGASITKLPTKPEKQARAAAPEAGGGSLVCDVCGKECAGAVGLGIHRSRKHGIKGTTRPAAKASPSALAPEIPPADDEDELRLRCGDCDSTFDPVGHFAKLRSHTMTYHGGRLPTLAESKPRTAAQVDEQSA